MNAPHIYDTGALIAAERHDRRLAVRHALGIRERRRLIIPAPVLAQAWRDGGGQASLARFVATCEVATLDEVMAKETGVLLGRSATRDVVDASVVALALALDGVIFTSDPDDISHLCTFAAVHRPALIHV